MMRQDYKRAIKKIRKAEEELGEDMSITLDEIDEVLDKLNAEIDLLQKESIRLQRKLESSVRNYKNGR